MPPIHLPSEFHMLEAADPLVLVLETAVVAAAVVEAAVVEAADMSGGGGVR